MMCGISSMVHPACARGGDAWTGGGLFFFAGVGAAVPPRFFSPWRMERMMCFCAQDDARG
eukprot:8241691-Prorocentrum_lima.AAC.1